MDDDAKQRGPGFFRRRPLSHTSGAGPDDAELSPPVPCTIYTAGQCDGARGPGGWACVAVIDGVVQEESGEEAWTTPLRADLLAAIRGLTLSPSGRTIQLITNSQAVARAMVTRQVSPPVWRSQPPEDGDLWEQLAGVTAERQVDWGWLRVYAAKATRDHYPPRVLQLAHAAAQHAVGHSSEGGAGVGTGDAARGVAGRDPGADMSPLPHAMEERVAGTEDGAAVPGSVARLQALVAHTEPLSSIGEEGHMNIDEMADRGVADAAATAPAPGTAVPEGEPEGTGRDEQRRLLIAECGSLEQRWTAISAQVVDLDAEWQHLVGQIKGGEDAAQQARPLDWADGVLLFRDLGQHATRLSGLTEEALRTCKQYALALQRAMEGLEI